MQAPDATICSSEGSYVGNKSIDSSSIKENVRIKAYVDFSEFNKNYEQYLLKQQTNETDCYARGSPK